MHSFPTDLARRRLIHGAALAAAGTALPFLARAQGLFGKQPITLLVPYPAGGATDVQARALALAASRELKQQIKSPHSSPQQVEAAVRELQKMPRDASATRLRNRDQIDGRPRAYLRKFGLSRVNLRSLAHRGELPGVTKSSW